MDIPRTRPRLPAAILAAAAALALAAPAAAALDPAARDGAAVAATYAAVSALWDAVEPALPCGADRVCLRAAAPPVAEVAAGRVPSLVRSVRRSSAPCVTRTAEAALAAARLARTRARSTLKGSRRTAWPVAVVDALLTVQMSANACAEWGGGL